MTKTYRDVGPEDFPQIWQRPSFEDLLVCLTELHADAEPPIWDPAASKKAPREGRSRGENTARSRRDVMSYLGSIVSSALQWLADDEQREVIWEAASRCLSQRCGRAGMGEITRAWPFRDRPAPFELSVREPPITGDSLGHKTWGSSFLMAQLLDGLRSGPLAHLLLAASASRSRSREPPPSAVVLELGSGTGLLGIAAAAMWQAEVVLSDLPDIMPNLDYNIERNRATVERLGGKVDSGALTWGCEVGNDARFSRGHQFSIILAADGIYDDDHPALLSSAIHEQLHEGPDARAVVMVPIRDQITRRLITQFQLHMNKGSSASASPLVVLEEHVLAGQDDWGDDDDQPQAVECWWAIFGRQLT
ncbi:S-adenosylmethionine-dependent methyltransferase-like protein [Nemania sp. NC0429]|nr:S-adenosylmethionine-dependent methyltransferase-like protein [Nemania sp. NC0429]